MDIKDKITEQPSRFDHLEQMSVSELLQHINEEDSRVADAVHEALPQIQAFVEAVEQRMKRGGRLFYVGAGTSGRLGVLDASELPPTFGAPDTWVIGIIAGGNKALRKAVEQAEDDPEQGAGWYFKADEDGEYNQNAREIEAGEGFYVRGSASEIGESIVIPSAL